MGIRTILAGLSGGTASEGTAELACHLAARFAPHLEALHVGLDVAGLIIAAGAEGLTAAGEMSWAKQMAAAVEAQSQKTKSALAVAADRHGLKLAAAGALGETSVIWHEARGEAAAVLARSARLFDLVVLGRSDRVVDAPHTDVIEETLLHSGRPLLLAPADPPSSVGETVAIGWNGSPQAVRALVAALPFLHSAKKAVIITLGEPDGGGVDALKAYLQRHGIGARLSRLPLLPGEGPAGQLLLAAREAEADLLVVGGYSRPPWREAIFGGVTRELVGVSLLPLLIAH